MSNYQLSFEDLEKEKQLRNEPTRYAFVDEFGGFGFDFSKVNTSKYFILCSIIVRAEQLSKLENAIDVLRKKYFSNSEMKSSNIGSDDKRRMVLITEILKLDFRIIALVADKEDFYNSALTNYKQVFYKYMHKLLYNNLYLPYPKLKIYADELGDEDFKNGFKKYISNNRPTYNIFNEYDFDFVDSTSSNLVQLADIIVGSIARKLNDDNAPNYIEILKGKISHIEYFPNKLVPHIENSERAKQFDEKIYSLACSLVNDYIEKNVTSDDTNVRLRVGFLKILLFEVQNGNPFLYVTSYSILNALNEYVDIKVSRDHLYRKIVAPLRDERIIIASSSQGYKIPVSSEDIYTYLNQTNTIVSPMLHRIEICRDLIKSKTDNELDILDVEPYLKYKKYFD